MEESLEATLARLPAGADHDPRVSLRGWGEAATIDAATPSGHPPPPQLTELPTIVVHERDEGPGELAVLRTLGEGGMGRVVLARQRSLRRSVAVKRAHAHRSPELLHEGVVTGMLEHPNIPPIHLLSRDEECRVVLVMKNIEGVTWADVLRDPEHPLRARSPLFSGVAELVANLEILAQLCNALELAHSKGVVHRDIKPENVMLGSFGEVYLIDWGIAYHADWGQSDGPPRVVGTPLYMAPEMAAGRLPDARTDVYLLGATLFEVLTGEPPHQADSVRAALLSALVANPPELGPEVPAELAALCRRALARDPAERFASVREVRAALREFLAHRASIALTEEAAKGMERLRDLLATPDADPTQVAQLHSQCRFALHQALREWRGNAAAKQHLSEMARALGGHELGHENPRGARAHLADIDGGDVELERAIEALEEELRGRAQREAARLEQEREMDVRNAQRERTLLYAMGMTATGAVGLTRALVPVDDDLAARHGGMLTLWGALFAASLVGLVVFRRTLLASEINRRVVWMTVASFVFVALNRATGFVLLPGAAITLAGDCAVLGAIAFASARGLPRRIAWGAVPYIVGCGALWIWPTHEALIFNVTAIVAFVFVIGGLRRQTRQME